MTGSLLFSSSMKSHRFQLPAAFFKKQKRPQVAGTLRPF